MTDSGNSGFGYEPVGEPIVKAVQGEAPTVPPTVAGACKRCGHDVCNCLVILAGAIMQWTSADTEVADRIAGEVWANTRSFRLGEAPIPEAPLVRYCTFCGAAVRRLDDGTIVRTSLHPTKAVPPDPTCDNSPTKRHALP